MGVEVQGDAPIRVRGMGKVGGGFDGGGISTAVMDVASQKARGEQADRGQEVAGRTSRGLSMRVKFSQVFCILFFFSRALPTRRAAKEEAIRARRGLWVDQSAASAQWGLLWADRSAGQAFRPEGRCGPAIDSPQR